MKLTEDQLTTELRAIRPAAEPAFAAELNERASEWFGAARRGSLLSRIGAIPKRRLVPVLGAAATLALITTVVASQLASPGGGPSSVADHRVAPAVGVGTSSKPATGAERTLDAGPAASTSSSAAAGRQVASTATMTLSTDPGKVADVAAGVVQVTNDYHGFIVTSSVSTGGSSTSRGHFDLRIPTAHLQNALADLSGLAHVSVRNNGTIDITTRTNTARDTIDKLRFELSNTSDPTLRAALQRQLTAEQAHLSDLKKRVQYTPVDVTILGDAHHGWTLGAAAHDAGSVLKAIAGGLLIGLAILLPLGLLGGALWLAWRSTRRRLRERALD